MIRGFLPSILMTINTKRRFSIIARSLVLIAAIWLIGCIDDLITDDGDVEDVTGEIVMHKTGGFAGVSQTVRIGEDDGSILLAYVDQGANRRKESHVSPEDLDQLWQTLEENDVFTLSTNQEMLESVMDGFFFEITVQRGEKYNRFSVYAPDLLVGGGETRYNAISQAIEHFADSQLRTSEEFIIADMPINDISVQILESFPLQVHVVVSGYLRDACTTTNETTQRREGNTIYIRITTKRPKDEFCAQVITEVTVRVPLEGGFLPGRYKVIVNDVEKEFEIQGGTVPDQENGILQGKVTIGPLCPVEPCDLTPEQIAGIYKARKAIVYERSTETEIAEVNLGRTGEYSFSLRPGAYIVDVTDAEGNELPLDVSRRPRIGNAIPREVEVGPGDVVVVDFDIDTGIR